MLRAFIVCLFFPSMLAAQDLRLDRLVPGTRHVFESSERGRYSLTYLHGIEGGFIIEERDADADPATPAKMIIHTDPWGRWLSQTTDQGVEIRFEPHNCLRMASYCEYEAFIDDQPGFPMARQAFGEGDELRYELFRRDTDPPQIVQEGTVALDAYGLVLKSTFTRENGAVTHTIERVETVIPGPDRGPLPEPSLILR